MSISVEEFRERSNQWFKRGTWSAAALGQVDGAVWVEPRDCDVWDLRGAEPVRLEGVVLGVDLGVDEGCVTKVCALPDPGALPPGEERRSPWPSRAEFEGTFAAEPAVPEEPLTLESAIEAVEKLRQDFAGPYAMPQGAGASLILPPLYHEEKFVTPPDLGLAGARMRHFTIETEIPGTAGERERSVGDGKRPKVGDAQPHGEMRARTQDR